MSARLIAGCAIVLVSMVPAMAYERADITGLSLVLKAQQFRRSVGCGDYAAARAMMSDTARRWFEERQGPGQPWHIGPGASGPWAGWDHHFSSRMVEMAWRSSDRTAILTVRETNDFFQLLDRGWVTNEIVYYFNTNGSIEGMVVRAVGERPPGRTEEFRRWAGEHAPAELDYLMPGGEIDPGGDRPLRFRKLLNRWRHAAGLPPAG